MKKHLLFIFMLFLGFSIKADTVSNKSEHDIFDEITFKDNQIKVAGKCKGKYDVKVKDTNLNSKNKTTAYEVSIFSEDGIEVAMLNIQVINKMKRRGMHIIDASLKTLKDNVNHNSSNFINYGEVDVDKSKEFEVPQFDNVVKYLLSYKYF